MKILYILFHKGDEVLIFYTVDDEELKELIDGELKWRSRYCG